MSAAPCCRCHESQIVFVPQISQAELDQKRKQTLSKLKNSSDPLCSLWFIQTSLKCLLEKTPKNKKNPNGALSSLFSTTNHSTPSAGCHSSVLQPKDTPPQTSLPLVFGGTLNKKGLNFSLADPLDTSESQVNRRSSHLNASRLSRELPNLGLNFDDSRFSWTSSLATPSVYTTEDAMPDEDDTELQEKPKQPKVLARALFSPDKEQPSNCLDGFHHLSTNIAHPFKVCDRTPSAIDSRNFMSPPNTLFSPILFESKNEKLKNETERCLLENSLSISSSDPCAVDKFDYVSTPVTQQRTDSHLHSILSKKNRLTSTPKHVHFSELSPLTTNCDKISKHFRSADKLRHLRDSSGDDSNFQPAAMLPDQLKRPNDMKIVCFDRSLEDTKKSSEKQNPCSDSLTVSEPPRSEDSTVSKPPHSDGLTVSERPCSDDLTVSELPRSEDSTVSEPPRSDGLTVSERPCSDDLTVSEPPRSEDSTVSEPPRSDGLTVSERPCSDDLTVSEPPRSEDSTVSEPPRSDGLTVSERPCSDDLTVSEPPRSEDSTVSEPPHSDGLTVSERPCSDDLTVSEPPRSEDSTVSEPLRSEDSTVSEPPRSDGLTVSERPCSEDLTVSEPPRSEDSTVSKPPRSDGLTVSERPCSDDLIVSDFEKEDKNAIFFTQLSSSYNEKLISEVDRMLNKNLSSAIQHFEFDQSLKDTENISETKMVDIDTKLSRHIQQEVTDQCSAVVPIKSHSDEKLVGLLTTTPKNPPNIIPDAASTPTVNVGISICGKLRRKSKGFLYPTASQISHTSPQVAFKFNKQGLAYDKPNHDVKDSIHPTDTVNSDIQTSAAKSNQEINLKTLDDFESDPQTLVSENPEASTDICNFLFTSDKMHEMPDVDPISNKGKFQSCSEIEIDSSINSIPSKMTLSTKLAPLSNLNNQQETEILSCQHSQNEPLQPNNGVKKFPNISNNQSPLNIYQTQTCRDVEIHQKTKTNKYHPKAEDVESKVLQEKPRLSSTLVSVKNEKNSIILEQNLTIPEFAKETECKQQVGKSYSKELSLSQNLQEDSHAMKQSTSVANDQQVEELNFLTPSQMIKWKEFDHFSQTFLENDNSFSLQEPHCENGRVCTLDTGSLDGKMKQEEKLSDFAKEKMQSDQNDNFLKTQSLSKQFASTEHNKSRGHLFSVETKIKQTKLKEEKNEDLKNEEYNKNLSSVSFQCNSSEQDFNDDKILDCKDAELAMTLEDCIESKTKDIKFKTVVTNGLNEKKTVQLNIVTSKPYHQTEIHTDEMEFSNEIHSFHLNKKSESNLLIRNDTHSLQSEQKQSTNIDYNCFTADLQILNLKDHENLTRQNEQRNSAKSKRYKDKGFLPFKAPRILSKDLTGNESYSQEKKVQVKNADVKPELNDGLNESSDNEKIMQTRIISIKEKSQTFNSENVSENQTICKQISVREESLKKAQNLISEETNQAQSFGGFSTAKGKQISVKEESLKKAQNLISEETNQAQSFGGFSTAKGKQISVKEESLKKAQNLISEETNQAQSFGGFSTAKGKQISVKEESLKKAQNLISEETNQAQSFGGFSTAKGKQISVKEESLKKAQNLISEETNQAQSFGGFSTAKGKQISVKEESLKKAQNLISEETNQAQSFGGFSTAKGKQISVKEESLKKAQNLISEETNQAQSFGGFSTAKGKQISVKEESLKKAQNLISEETNQAQSFGGFSTAKGKQISVKEESLKKAQNLISEETNQAQSFGGFSTAKGKQISVKEESLKKAQNLISEETNQAQSFGGFSTAKGKQISVKEESLKKAQNLISEETNQAQSFGGFSTAKGKQISVKEESLKKAQNLISEETNQAQSFGGFSTAKGKQISVKEESLKKAQNLISEETNQAQSFGGFSTAKGKQISVKEESLKKAQNLISEETNQAQSFGGFSTAKGKQISVKEESLKKAQNLISEETNQAQSFGGFSTAKGKQISVKEESLKKAQNLISEETNQAQSFGGFSTAKGKQISVKEESLKKAQNLISEETNQAQSFGSFSTAKGKQISVKEESLKKAQNLISEETNQAQSFGGFSTAKGKQISVKEESLKKAQNLISEETNQAQSFGGFSTAKGKQISVKEESLKKAQNLISEETNQAQSFGGFSTAKGKQISVKEESLKKAQNLISEETNQAQSFGGFSTAKGKQISVKEESLKKAQNLISEETNQAQSFGGFSTAKGKQISVKEESLKKAQNLISEETNQAQSFGGFSTAKGKQISVKEESLKKAQNLISEETNQAQSFGGFSTAKGKQISVKEESLKKAQNLISEETNQAQSFGGFSTAKGKQISVKEESLKKAQNLMSEETNQAQSFGGFSTAKGKQISVKEESLKKAQNLISEETNQAQSFGGFSTAKGKQISVKEESLKKAQNLISEETNQAQSFEGFSTAKGKQISVKEESLKKAQNLISEETNQAQSFGGFSTAKGKQISVKEESLKKAQNLISEETNQAQSFGGFSIAKGRQNSVKEESLKKAQNLISEETNQAQSFGGFSTAKGKQISVKEESLKKAQNLISEETNQAQSFGGFSTAKGKQISVKEESLKKAQNLISEETNQAQSFGGFSIAKGKQISVKEESLKKAQNLISEETNQAQSFGGFSIAKGKQISVKEESLKKAQNLISEETNQAPSFEGFSISESLMEPVDNFSAEDDDNMVEMLDHIDDDVVNELMSTDFTASQMKRSESTSNIISDCRILDNDRTPTSPSIKTDICNDNTHLTGDMFNSSWDDDASILSNLTENLQSHSDYPGNKRKHSDKSLTESFTSKKKIKIDAESSSTLSVDHESSEKNFHHDPTLPMANIKEGKSCKSQYISDDTLMQSVKLYENQSKTEFQTVSVDSNAQAECDCNHYRLHDDDGSAEHEMVLAIENVENHMECGMKISSTETINSPSIHQFMRENSNSFEANKVISLETSEGLSQENTNSDFNPKCFSDNSIKDIDDKLCYENDLFEFPCEKFQNDSSVENRVKHKSQSATSKISFGFQTGLGREVLVSKESLQKAVKMLDSESIKSEMNAQPKTFAAFQTGLGKTVHVSETSLHEAVKTLNKQTPREEDHNPQKMKPSKVMAFQTALGKNVPISEESVKKARQFLDAETVHEEDICSKKKYLRKSTSAVHCKSEVESHVEDPPLDNSANSVPSIFKSLQQETNKINLLCQKKTNVSWQPCMSAPECDRPGFSPFLTNHLEILSDQSFGTKHNSFSDLISHNALDEIQRTQEKNLGGKTGPNSSSKKVDFKTPYRKVPAISEVEESVKVFPKISRPVFGGYKMLPDSPDECSKHVNLSNVISSTSTDFSNTKKTTEKLKSKQMTKSLPFPRNQSFSSSQVASNFTKPLEEPKDHIQNTKNFASANSSSSLSSSHVACNFNKIIPNRNEKNPSLVSNKSTVETHIFSRKDSDCKQVEKTIPKNEVCPQEKHQRALVSTNLDTDVSSYKHSIREVKESRPVEATNQKKISIFPHKTPCSNMSLMKDKKDVSATDKSSVNKGNDVNTNKQSKSMVVESVENLCNVESHFEEGRLEQDMVIIRNKRKKILPQNGLLTYQKSSRKRIRLSDLMDSINTFSFSSEQFFACGISSQTLRVSSATASDYRFELSAFYNVKCLHRIIIGDGATLVPDANFTAGKDEFFRAFQTIEGVDPKLISRQWLFNHYRWIVWKLAAYEVALPQLFGGRCLRPEMVALQLKFRYDLEIDKCQRSALRRILERDDTPAKRMVVCVSCINQPLDSSTISPEKQTPLTNLEITDGWYSTKLFLNPHLSFLRKLRIGQKLCLSNAEIVGSDAACTPLESPESVGLKVSGNCCRPARWDAKLGFQADPQPLCLPLVQIAADGGLVGCIDVIVTRIYPIRYMEKVPGGRSVFRTSRAENRQEQMHEILKQEAAEKLYNRLQALFGDCCPTQVPKKQCKNWCQEEVRHLDTGQELYEAMTCALQPDAFLDCLSQSQLVMLTDYKRIAEELKAQQMKDEFQKAVSSEEHSNLKRNVTPVMKVRLTGCSQLDRQQKASTILTIWRPSEDLQQLLEEGKRFRLYNVIPSPARSFFLSGLDVHLTVTRSTHFESLKIHPSIPVDLFQPRKISSAIELQTESNEEDQLEVDVTGIVLRITKTVNANQRKLELLYAVDTEGNIFALRFWGGLQIFSVNDLLLEGVVFAGLNLLLRHASSPPHQITPIAMLDVCSEVTHFSVNPSDNHLRDSINELHKLKALNEFLLKSQTKLDSMLNANKTQLSVTKTSSMTEVCVESLMSQECDEARLKQKMLQESKRTKLLMYGNSPSLSPLPIQLPSNVRRAFKPPSATKSENN